MCVPNLYVTGYFHSLMTHLKSCCVYVFVVLMIDVAVKIRDESSKTAVS